MAGEEWISAPKRRSSVIRRTVYSRHLSVGGTTFSLNIILVIAIGGALVLFTAIGAVIVLHLKKRNRYKSQVHTEISRHGLIRSDPSNMMRSIRTPEIIFPRRVSRGLSSNPWRPLDGVTPNHDWKDVDLSDRPPIATAKRLSFHRGIVRVGESWPLSTNIPLKMLPMQATMALNPVAPPGYMVREPKRQSTKLSRIRDSTDSKRETEVVQLSECSPTRELIPAPLMLHKNTQQRSTSDTHIPAVIRSSSQRTRATNQRSLIRALTTMGRLSGPVPPQRLLTPPMKQVTESREQLINKEFAKSMEDNRVARTTLVTDGSSLTNQGSKSPAPSEASIYSLCDEDVLEIVPPVALSSPSKSNLRGEKRHKVQISEDTTITPSIHEDRPGSLLVITNPIEEPFLNAPHRISLAGDPFFSSVRSSKSIISSAQVHGPRPMYFRKCTFGHEESPNRPEDYVSPLRDVSGNIQSPPRTPNVAEDLEHNPFRWSPQEAINSRITPISGRTSPTRKGHKRSNVVRMSNLSIVNRHISTVDVVKEKPEEDSARRSIRFSLPPATTTRAFEPENSPSPPSSTTSRRRSMRPPSSATFSPDLTIAEGLPTTPNSSPDFKFSSQRSFSVYSPTLSVCHYHAENGSSDDEFFKPKKSSLATLEARRHGHNYSEDIITLPSLKLEQDSQLTIASFPAIPEPAIPESDIPIMAVLTPPPSRPLPTIASTMTDIQPAPQAPPLNFPGQSQLYGPRDIPSRASTLSPSHDSLLSSIYVLRRMNSQMSQYSLDSTIAEESPRLPRLPPQPHFSLNFNVEEAVAEERGRIRGSKHYLAIGRNSQHYSRMSRTERRDSHRVYKDRRKRKTEDFDRDGKELTPVPETSPATGSNALGLMGLPFSTLIREGVNVLQDTPTRNIHFTVEEDISDARMIKITDDGKENSEATRWSDAMTKPAKNAVRRESQMEHPSPQTPPKWTMGGLGLAGQRLLGKDEEGPPIFGSPERPASIGLYDKDGFLKSSPDINSAREKANLMREKEAKPKRVSDEWHCVM